MTVRAVQITMNDLFIRGMTRWAFEMVTPAGERLVYARPKPPTDDDRITVVRGGWFRYSEVETREFGPRYDGPDPDAYADVLYVDLDTDIAPALADAILLEATGTPAGDVRALRADLTHERARRDALEDRMTDMLDRMVPVISGAELAGPPREHPPSMLATT